MDDGTRHLGRLYMIGFIVAGLVIGALVRIIKPGMQNLSVVVTGSARSRSTPKMINCASLLSTSGDL